MLNFQYFKFFFCAKNNIGNFIFCQKTILKTLFSGENQYWNFPLKLSFVN